VDSSAGPADAGTDVRVVAKGGPGAVAPVAPVPPVRVVDEPGGRAVVAGAVDDRAVPTFSEADAQAAARSTAVTVSSTRASRIRRTGRAYRRGRPAYDAPVVLIIVVVVVVVLLLLYVIASYNGLVRLRNRIDNAWAQIDVQLRRRYDLIPNLVNTVKGYASHEKGTFEAVTAARANAINASGVAGQAQAENQITGALKSLFAVAEAYPDLKANQNFLELQEELSGTEGRIAYARQFYNDSVLKLNTKIQSFPSNILANAFGFTEREYFEADDASRGPVSVQF
jgi:LemA protein